jgi:membrane glycosyltransferase
MRRRGLLLTPEETEPPAELASLEHLMATGGVLSAAAAQEQRPLPQRPVVAAVAGQTALAAQEVPEVLVPRVPVPSPLPMEASRLVYLLS